MSIAVRNCEPSDLPFAARCMVAAANERPGESETAVEAAELTAEHFRDKPESGRLLVLEDARGIVGYAVIAVYWSHRRGGLIVQIDDLYVTPASRTTAVEFEFLHWLQGQWTGRAKALRAEVDPANRREIGCYQQMGFQPSGLNHCEKVL